jgi:hypothetical protein
VRSLVGELPMTRLLDHEFHRVTHAIIAEVRPT